MFKNLKDYQNKEYLLGFSSTLGKEGLIQVLTCQEDVDGLKLWYYEKSVHQSLWSSSTGFEYIMVGPLDSQCYIWTF